MIGALTRDAPDVRDPDPRSCYRDCEHRWHRLPTWMECWVCRRVVSVPDTIGALATGEGARYQPHPALELFAQRLDRAVAQAA
jgi:hypothetical protein